MTFPIFPKLWNGPTALGESRVQAQVPGLSYQTTFAGNTEVRKSGDFIDIYQKKDAGLFISWGDLQKDIGWTNGIGSSAIDWWTPTCVFPQEYRRFPVISSKLSGKFAARDEPVYTLPCSSAPYRAPGGRLALVSGGTSFAIGGKGTSQRHSLTEGLSIRYSLQTTTTAAKFTTMFSVDSISDASAAVAFGGGFTGSHAATCRTGQYSAPFGAKTSAGWTIGLGWRGADVDGRKVPMYTYRDVDGAVKTSAVSFRPGAHYGSVPFVTRVGPTKLFAVTAKYFDAPARPSEGDAVVEWAISIDNGATWTTMLNWPDELTYPAAFVGFLGDNFYCAALAKLVRVLPHSANQVLVYTFGIGQVWHLYRVTLNPFEIVENVPLRAVALPSPELGYGEGLFPDVPGSTPDGEIRGTFFATYSGTKLPVYAALERSTTSTTALLGRVALTSNFVDVEVVNLPWKHGLFGDPKWLDDTTILMPVYDVAERAYNLYESKDNFRTWTKKATLYDSTDNRAWAPRAAELGDPDSIRNWPELVWDSPNNTYASLGLMPPGVNKLDRFSTVEWLRDEQGRQAAANPFSGRWICDDSAPPPEL